MPSGMDRSAARPVTISVPTTAGPMPGRLTFAGVDLLTGASRLFDPRGIARQLVAGRRRRDVPGQEAARDDARPLFDNRVRHVEQRHDRHDEREHHGDRGQSIPKEPTTLDGGNAHIARDLEPISRLGGRWRRDRRRRGGHDVALDPAVEHDDGAAGHDVDDHRDGEQRHAEADQRSPGSRLRTR